MVRKLASWGLYVQFLWAVMACALVASACGGSDSSDSTDSDTTTEAAVDTGTGETDPDPDDSAEGDDDAMAEEPEVEDPDDPAPIEDEDQLTSSGEGDPATVGDPIAGGEITWGLTNDGTGFNTTGAVAPGSIRVITALNDSLMGVNTAGDWVPNTAESMVANDDFTLWTLTLRPGIEFHDGEPLNADAVVANLEGFRSGLGGFTFANVDTVTAVGEFVVEIAMKSPWAAFPHQLVNQPGWMVSPATVGQNDTFVGVGPFMLESWTPGDGARVVRNPNYWRADEGLPYLDAINFKFLVDQTVKRQALEAGDIEGYISPGDDDILDYLEDDSVDVWIGEAAANEYTFILNTARAPFDDIRVRRAMAHATDRQFLIDTFRSGLTTPANGPISPSSRWWVDTDYPDYDPDRAAALIAEYEAEVGPVVFEVSAEPNASVLEVIEVAISFWEDAGIEATINEIGQGQSASTAIADDFDVFSWFQFSSLDPDGLYTFMHTDGGLLNWANYNSEKIDEGLRIGRESDDYETRLAGYALMQEGFAEDVPYIWIDHLNGVEAAVTIPQLHGIGSVGELPDGEPSIPMVSGSFFAWTGVWLEQ